MTSPAPDGGLTPARLFKLLFLLWLAGTATRVTIIAVPPVLPLIHDDLHLSETQVGLLIGLPVALFAVAAVPGSLLIARLGASLTMLAGMIVTALGAGGRGFAADVWTLYGATMLMGLGIAIMQPALPTLVREWVPGRIGFGTAIASNGMVVGGTLAPALTIPLVLPLVGQSWRLDLVFWALPVVATAILFYLLGPRAHWRTKRRLTAGRRWWPDFRSPTTWLLGLTFGSNNSIYYGVNAFLPDYLVSVGHADLLGSGLGWFNGAQLIGSCVLLLLGEALHRRAWPYLVFASMTLAALLAILLTGGSWIVVAAALLGFSSSVTFVLCLALPPLLSAPDDVHRTSAGMFTVSYACAVIIPTLSGALWDVTHRPFMAFVPLCLCAVTLGALGAECSRRGARQRDV
jgi:CP family cyanate transporter-like MFS transporter